MSDLAPCRCATWTLALLAGLVLGLTACGETGDSGDSVDAGSAAATLGSEQASPPPPPPPAREAKQVLRAYYAKLNFYGYRAAWRHLSPEVQADLGGFNHWRGGYRTNLWTRITDVDTVSQNSGEVVFAVSLRSKDIDECGDRVHQTFAGEWTLERVPGTGAFGGSGWRGAAISMNKTGGGEVITDPAQCPYANGGGSGYYVPPVESDSYEPQYSTPPDYYYDPYDSGNEYGDPGYYEAEQYDLDCEDFYGSMPTPYGDPNNLDGDNDGVACE